MIDLNLVCLYFQECYLFPQISDSLSEILNFQINLGKIHPDLEKYNHEGRKQYDAAGIISGFEENNISGRTILITSVDLYIPIFTFIFGLAKLNGETGIVSSHRLLNEFYGLPPDQELLKERLIKEIIHELGHLLDLRHCSNYKCVMASSHTVDDIDIKGKNYCGRCLKKIHN